eukprot:11124553-Karenia_brevis.AAC.1
MSFATQIYETQGVPTSSKKEERRMMRTCSLGVAMRKEEGIFELPQEVAFDWLSFTVFLCQERRVSKKAMQIAGGRWVRAFLLRRHCFMALDALWK